MATDYRRNHTHRKPACWHQDGYAPNAPSYHIERCVTTKRCKVTRLTLCPHRQPGQPANFGQTDRCPVCDS